MKKLVFAIFILLSINVFAQNISFGPKLGANVIYLQKNDLKYKDYSLNTHFGANAEVAINENFSISADLLYSSKRKNYQSFENVSLIKELSGTLLGVGLQDSALFGVAQFLNDTVYGTRTGTVKLNYIELPVLARFNYKGVSVGVGPYVAFLQKAQSVEIFTQESPLLDIAFNALDSIPFAGPFIKGVISAQFPGYENPQITESTDKSKYVTIDVGFVLDLSYRFSSNVYTSFRYTQGFIDYRKTTSGDKETNKVLQFSVGYNFGKNFSSKPKGIYDLGNKPIEK